MDPKNSVNLKSQTIVQEYVELKRLINENSALVLKNQCLTEEFNGLELKMLEAESLLGAKETELSKFIGKTPNDLDTQVKILESENSRLKESLKSQKIELLKNEISQNLQFKAIYGDNFKEVSEKSSDSRSLSLNPLENEKNRLALQLKKQEILLQEAVNDRDYIKNEVLPVLESTLHLYEKNKFDLDGEIQSLESKLKIIVPNRPDNIIYEEDEFEPTNVTKNSRENSPIFSPKQSLQYSFISSNRFSARPASAKLSLASPRAKLMKNQLKTKKVK